jgi:hypothetical protein
MIDFITNTVICKIYKTKTAMRRAIRKAGFDCDHTEAMVIPCTVYNYSSGKKVKVPVSAELYLHENASLPVVVHETLHAATSAIRHRKHSLNLGYKIQRNEERLAYTQTAILQDVLKIFFPKKNSDYNLKDIEWWVKGSVKASRKK